MTSVEPKIDRLSLVEPNHHVQKGTFKRNIRFHESKKRLEIHNKNLLVKVIQAGERSRTSSTEENWFTY